MKHLCTIITPDWVDAHLSRWLRYVKRNCPDTNLYLFYVGGNIDADFPTLRDQFEAVEELPAEGRAQFNRIRMSATTTFGVGAIGYLDADSDVLADISAIPELVGDSTLAFVDSPAIHKPWSDLCRKLGKGSDWSGWAGNNGLLYMTEDWGERYDKAVKAVEDTGISPRIIGTVAFNYMLRENEGWTKLPYEFSTIWWDSEFFRNAKVIQYCNDNGQRKRVMMEEEWRMSRVDG